MKLDNQDPCSQWLTEALLSRAECHRPPSKMTSLDFTKQIPGVSISASEYGNLRDEIGVRLRVFHRYGSLRGYKIDDVISELVAKIMEGKRKSWNKEQYETPLIFLKAVAQSIISNEWTLARNQQDKDNQHIDSFDNLESHISQDPAKVYAEQQGAKELYFAAINFLSQHKPYLVPTAEVMWVNSEVKNEELATTLGVSLDKARNDRRSLMRFIDKCEMAIGESGKLELKLKEKK